MAVAETNGVNTPFSGDPSHSYITVQSVLPHVILLAEDDPDHAHLVQAVFQRVAPEVPIMHVIDGEKAISYLSGEGDYSDRSKFPIPSLLLLDLKMPRLDGLEVLAWIRKSPEWSYLPVTILTGSELSRDVDEALKLGANSFMVKPQGLPEFLHRYQTTLGTLAQERDSASINPGVTCPD